MSKKIIGTNSKPRISIFRSNYFIDGQAIDDEKSNTVAAASSKKMKAKLPIERAKEAGIELGKNLISKKIETAVYDRNGYRYHGQVAAFADGLRESGIKL